MNEELEIKAENFIRKKLQEGMSRKELILHNGLLKHFPPEKINELIDKVKFETRKSIYVGIRLVPQHYEFIKNNPSQMIRDAIVKTYLNNNTNSHGE